MVLSPTSLIFIFLALLSKSSSSISSSPHLQLANTSISIPLSLFSPESEAYLYQPPWQKLYHLVESSLLRARRIKNPRSKSITTALSSHSYGGYSIPLAFGTPPQTIPLVMDTGSDVVWFPCTSNYRCNNCSFSSPNQKHRRIKTFIPKLSSTSKILGCLNPKCRWLHKLNVTDRCKDCSADSRNCTQICEPYLLLYGSGSTGGVLLSETLDLTKKITSRDFIVGCSLFSSSQPAGIAGFGRGLASLPSQLGVKEFSYCLVSRRFDDSPQSGVLTLNFAASHKTSGVSYTPFVKNPKKSGSEDDLFSVYYYVNLRKITIGGDRVKIPRKYLVPDSDGNSGTIVDSGTTFTFMAGEVFELISRAFAKRVKTYPRAKQIEIVTGLRPCFNFSGVGLKEPISIPEMSFHFKGGAEMRLPLANYFSLVGSGEALCLTVVTDSALQEGGGGPSIILGNFQMQNFYVEFDLRHERFGFTRRHCNK